MSVDNIKDILSITKDDQSAFVKDIKTRMLANRSKLFSFENDEKPLRMDELHYVSVLGMGGLYPCPDVVDAIMDPSNSNGPGRKTVLELGCRTGIWSVEMARNFPNSQIIGIDKKPVPIAPDNVPKNCRFETNDINGELSRFHGQIDVALVRNTGGTITDYSKTMKDIEACLKPGGIAIFIDIDLNFYLKDTSTTVPLGLDAEEGGDPDNSSWIYRLVREFGRSLKYDGSDLEGLATGINGGLWEHLELIDPDTIRTASVYTPIGPWLQISDKELEERLNLAGALMRRDCYGMLGMFEHYSIKRGVPEATVKNWSKRAIEGLEAMKFPMSVRWACTWGRRRAGENLPAPALAINPSMNSYALLDAPNGQNAQQSEYRSHQMYKTQEEAKKATEERNESLKRLPVPLVQTLMESKRLKESA